MADRPALHALAERAGILAGYQDISGRHRRTPDSTLVAVAAAMGLDGSTEEAAATTLAELEDRQGGRLLPTVVVAARTSRESREVQVNLPATEPGPIEYVLELNLEDDRHHRVEDHVEAGAAPSAIWLPLPAKPGPGYHRLSLTLEGRSGDRRAEMALIVTPRSCVPVEERTDGRRGYGLWTHLYALRTREDWGIGDMGGLARLVDWAAEIGAAFIGLNPLHAVRGRGHDISPYGPISRLFRNVLYLDIEAIPELAESVPARQRLESTELSEALARLRSQDHVDYDGVLRLKLDVLRELHAAFRDRHHGRDTERGRAYRKYLEDQGPELMDYATFRALQGHFEAEDVPDFRTWPTAYRDPRSRAVRDFRRRNQDEVHFHCYLQFELDRQLARVVRGAAAAGLPIGLYGDLAIGTARDGSDPWAFPELFVDGAHIGAPPDDYSRTGQNWGLPPVDPRQLKATGYRYWIELLRRALIHTGALRIDHVMGLFRQYWIPAGSPATRGAYVRYPADDLLGILALESRRQGSVIIGEDLGTVPAGLPERLAEWGILSSQVLYFERDSAGGFRRSSDYSTRALATANTHDHPPLRGFWEGRDLELRRQVGDLVDDDAHASARRERERDRQALLDLLATEGLLPSAKAPDSYFELCSAVHAFLARTPAPLVGVSLDDLTGETDPVNLPGVGLDRYPSWSRRMSEPLESIRDRSDVGRALVGLEGRRR